MFTNRKHISSTMSNFFITIVFSTEWAQSVTIWPWPHQAWGDSLCTAQWGVYVLNYCNTATLLQSHVYVALHNDQMIWYHLPATGWMRTYCVITRTYCVSEPDSMHILRVGAAWAMGGIHVYIYIQIHRRGILKCKPHSVHTQSQQH